MDLFGDLPDPTGDQQKGSQVSTLDKKGETAQQLITDRAEKRKADTTEPAPDEPNKQKQKLEHYAMRCYVADRKGEREEMQDAHIQIDDYTKMFTSLHPSIGRLALYGVFDGHGGARASRRHGSSREGDQKVSDRGLQKAG